MLGVALKKQPTKKKTKKKQTTLGHPVSEPVTRSGQFGPQDKTDACHESVSAEDGCVFAHGRV